MFQEDQLLCPVACLRVELRTPGIGLQLFLSILTPHIPASSSTIARWIKQTLQTSGVDVSTNLSSFYQGSSNCSCSIGRDFHTGDCEPSRLGQRKHILPIQFQASQRYNCSRGIWKSSSETRTYWSYKHAKDMLMEPNLPKYNWGMAEAACSWMLFLIVWRGWRQTSTYLLPTLPTQDGMALFILCWSTSDMILLCASAMYLFFGAKCNISGPWLQDIYDTFTVLRTEE